MESFTIISKVFEGKPIRQREEDGYISATDMCNLFDREFGNYNKSQTTKEYISALASDLPFGRSELVQIRKGGIPTEQGTWVHPLVATHLAQWLSPKFAIQVNKWVIRYLAGDITLIKDVIEQHDKVHDTVTTADILITDKDLIAHKEKMRAFDIEEQRIKTNYEIEMRKLDASDRELETRTTEQCTKLLTNVERFKSDAHLYTAIKGYILNTMGFNPRIGHQAITAEEIDPILLNKDITQLIVELGMKLPRNNALMSLGKEIAKEFRKRYKNEPLSVDKHVAGAIRSVKVYPPVDFDWIRAILKRRLR